MIRADLPPYAGRPHDLRRVFANYPAGVVGILAEVGGEPHGIVASSFMVGISADPPLVSVAIQRSSGTWPVLRNAARLGVSVFAADQEELCRRLASRDRKQRFNGVPIRDTGSSARFVAGATTWLECSLWNEFDAGDHTLALLEVEALGADPATEPLIFHASAFRGLYAPPSPSRVPAAQP